MNAVDDRRAYEVSCPGCGYWPAHAVLVAGGSYWCQALDQVIRWHDEEVTCGSCGDCYIEEIIE